MVIVFGSVNLDLVARVARIPAAGETLAGTSFVTAPGGKGANQALAARHAGAAVPMIRRRRPRRFCGCALANLASLGRRPRGRRARGCADRRRAHQCRRARRERDHGGFGRQCMGARRPGPRRGLARGNTLLMQLETRVAEVAALAAAPASAGARVVLNAAPASPLSGGPALATSMSWSSTSTRRAVCAGALGLASGHAALHGRHESPVRCDGRAHARRATVRWHGSRRRYCVSAARRSKSSIRRAPAMRLPARSRRRSTAVPRSADAMAAACRRRRPRLHPRGRAAPLERSSKARAPNALECVLPVHLLSGFLSMSTRSCPCVRSLAAALLISLALVRPAAAVDYTDIW